MPISPDSSLLDPVTAQRGLMASADARALVLIAHPNEASRRQAGHGFVADVLHANGFATLPFSLHTSQDMAAGLPPPSMVQGRRRLRGLIDWVRRQPGLGDCPLALIGVGDAASVCVAVAAGSDRSQIHCLVLLDARADKVVHHLARLSLPALFVLGQCDAAQLARQRVALPDIPAGHRLDMLSQPTLPQPAAGALEAFACSALEWLDRSGVRGNPAAGGAGGPSSRIGTGLGDSAPGPMDSRQRTAPA
jgi:predicted alpha/beta-hydrolase family hydrolase